MPARFVLGQISDLHVLAAQGDEPFDTNGNVRRALEQIAAFEPDIILATGDLANDARAAEYAALAPLLAQAPAPLFLVPGNHDDRDRLRAAFPAHAYLPHTGKLSYTIEKFGVRIVVLDSAIEGETGGGFDEDDAAWLEAVLSAAPATPTVVALHHPPFLTHERLFDRIGLAGRDAFAVVIARHPQVQIVIAGHHHRAVIGRVAHAPAVVAPATAYTYSLALRDNQKIGVKSAEAAFAVHVWDTPESAPVSHFISLQLS
jgi:3',5'-cyclic AMP phosphodiesterase CpdA